MHFRCTKNKQFFQTIKHILIAKSTLNVNLFLYNNNNNKHYTTPWHSTTSEKAMNRCKNCIHFRYNTMNKHKKSNSDQKPE